jgi:hypothetical protein
VRREKGNAWLICGYRIHAKLIAGRINTTFFPSSRRFGMGLGKGKSCSDCNFIVNKLLKKTKKIQVTESNWGREIWIRHG